MPITVRLHVENRNGKPDLIVLKSDSLGMGFTLDVPVAVCQDERCSEVFLKTRKDRFFHSDACRTAWNKRNAASAGKEGSGS